MTFNMDRLEFLTRRFALGQNFPLGTLYNARNDTFIPNRFRNLNLPHEAIERTPVDKVEIKVGIEDTFAMQFAHMDISPRLGLDILAGGIPLTGSGVYLSDKPTGKKFQAAIYHTITTTMEALNLRSTALKDCFTYNGFPRGEATHMVVNIEWGARSVVSLRRHAERDSKADTMKKQFQSDITAFTSVTESLQNSLGTSVDMKRLKQMRSRMEIVIYSDILDEDGVLMEDFLEAFEFLRLIPPYVRSQNHGRGFPVTYSLVPMEMFRFLVPSFQPSCINTFVPLPSDILASFLQIYQEFEISQQSLDALERNSALQQQYSPDLLSLAKERKEELRIALDDFKLQLTRGLQAARGGSNPQILRQLLAEYEGQSSPKRLSSIGIPYGRLVRFLSKAILRNAIYLGHNGLTFEDIITGNSSRGAFVMFFTPSVIATNDDLWQEHRDLLFEILDNRDPMDLVVIVDCEALSIPFDKVRIARYQSGQEIITDYVEHKRLLAGKCFAAYTDGTLETQNILKPIQRRHVTIPCPGLQCAVAEIREWICLRCQAPIEYGFSDEYIYCDCGRSLYTNYSFKCHSELHGSEFLQYDSKQCLRLLQGLDQSNYLNILILGETGVGKSTFINALINYLEFETLDEAMTAEKLNWVIPCSFSTQIMDRTNPNRPIEEKRISIGARDDEKDGSTGDSATQQTQVYPVTFTMGSSTLTVRLIDTPGMGDTRGVDADRKNMADILSTLSGYDELHGILILLKPNAARLTISFSYCIKELLTHLHHNASKNMVFGFTNTRISNYTPGDTYGPLKSLLNQHPDIGLSLSMPTTYCFDSESFRYLAASKSGVTMPNKLDFDRSWEHSRKESLRLLEHFKANTPHEVKSTMTLNGARQLIAELTKPIAEISQAIQTSIAMTEDKLQEIKDKRFSGDQLRSRLHVQKVQLNARPLIHPRTVCSNQKCVEIKSNGKAEDQLVTVYKTHCHPVCGLTNVQADCLAHPGLIQCAAFNGHDHCQQSGCGHHWQEHLHILYELEEETITVVDSAIEQQLRNHADDVGLRETALRRHEQVIEEYKQEREIIRDAGAKFGVFLRKNSLAPYNDALLAYLDHLIKEEQMKVQLGGNEKRLKSLTEERHKYKESIEVIIRNMNSKVSWNDLVLNEGAIDGMVQQLYSLTHFGAILKNLKQGVATAHQATYREIPYTVSRHTRQHKPVSLETFVLGRMNSRLDPSRTPTADHKCQASQALARKPVSTKSSLLKLLTWSPLPSRNPFKGLGSNSCSR